MALPNAYKRDQLRVQTSRTGSSRDTGWESDDGRVIFEKIVRYSAGNPNNPKLVINHRIDDLKDILDVQACVDNQIKSRQAPPDKQFSTLWSYNRTKVRIVTGQDQDYSKHDGLLVIRFTLTT